MKPRTAKTLTISMGCLVATLLTACSDDDDDSVNAPEPLACEELVGTEIAADSIELPTSGGTVTAAEVVAASGSGPAAIPEHCLVTGEIAPVDPSAPDIRFQVALPTEWNSKTLMLGGGGFNGTIPDVTANVPNGPVDELRPIGRGYATFASDSGHQANEYGSQDGRWGLNDEAVRNFGGEALKKTRDAATFIIKARYAREPMYSYFAGGSTGGREALTVIQRWPADWDGAIAWYPAWNNTAAWLGGHQASIALAQPGAYPDSPERKLVFDAAMEACDDLDGLRDGVISDQQECNRIFDPETATLDGVPIRCPAGDDTGDYCLSDAQIGALKTMNSETAFNFDLASGETAYPGYNVWGADLGITSIDTPVQPVVTFLALGTSQPAHPMPRTAPYISVLVDQWIKYYVTGDPTFNSLNLDPVNPGPWADRISEISKIMNPGTEIDAFADQGGKLLLAHGTVDVLVSTRATEEYFNRLNAEMGSDKVDSFVRYYEIPGLGHAVSSQFNATWDSLTALENWVEDGIAPENQVTTDTIGVPGRTRPMCEYPEWPRYRNGGDPHSADSFECVE